MPLWTANNKPNFGMDMIAAIKAINTFPIAVDVDEATGLLRPRINLSLAEKKWYVEAIMLMSDARANNRYGRLRHELVRLVDDYPDVPWVGR